jgi:hypothetical protein
MMFWIVWLAVNVMGTIFWHFDSSAGPRELWAGWGVSLICVGWLWVLDKARSR